MIDPRLALLIAGVLAGIGAVLFWPERGLYPRWREGRRMTERTRSEDALKYIHKCEMKGRRPTMESVAGTLHASLDDTAVLLNRMQSDGLLNIEGVDLTLTPNGRDSALHIIRAHRLWERYLAEETGFAEAEWHNRAERYEHELTPAQLDALSTQLGNPTHDPHGDPIPTAKGEMMGHDGRPLTSLEVDTPARIVHLEDEPAVVYAQLVAEGLHPGMIIRVTESSPERVRFWTNGNEHLLAPIVAANISVRPLPIAAVVDASAEEEPNYRPLSSLEPGKTATVTGISPASRGAERRRFMDLGILRGTKITAEMRSPSGDPTAYQVRGALIALRENQARLIQIEA